MSSPTDKSSPSSSSTTSSSSAGVAGKKSSYKDVAMKSHRVLSKAAVPPATKNAPPPPASKGKVVQNPYAKGTVHKQVRFVPVLPRCHREQKDAPTQPNDAPTQPNDAPTQPNDAPTQPNAASVATKKPESAVSTKAMAEKSSKPASVEEGVVIYKKKHSENISKPAPGKEYQALYNAGPKLKRKNKIVPRRLPTRTDKSDTRTTSTSSKSEPTMPGLNDPVRGVAKSFASVVAGLSGGDDKKKTVPRRLPSRADNKSEPTMPGLNDPVRGVAKSGVAKSYASVEWSVDNFNVDVDDERSDDLYDTSDDDKKPAARTMSSEPKKHTPGKYIRRYSFVSATLKNFEENGKFITKKNCEGMVLGAVAKGLWRVAFENDLKGYRDMKSRQLTLIRNNTVDPDSDASSETYLSPHEEYLYSSGDDASKEEEKDKGSEDDVEVLYVKPAPNKNIKIKQEKICKAGAGGKRKEPSSSDTDPEPIDREVLEIIEDSDDDNDRLQEQIRFRQQYQHRIDRSAGEQFTVSMKKKGQERQSIRWTHVRDDYQKRNNSYLCEENRRVASMGIKSPGLRHFLRNEELPLAHLYLYLANPDGDPTPVIERMNKLIEIDNAAKLQNAKEERIITSSQSDGNISGSDTDIYSPSKSGTQERVRLTKFFELREFLVFQALMIGAADAGGRGHQLWAPGGSNVVDEADQWSTIVPDVDFSQYMSLSRFKEAKKYYAYAWQNEQKKQDGDPWWQVIEALEEFNWNRKNLLLFSNIRVLDEIMSGFRPRATEKGSIPAPHLSFLPEKPVTFGHHMKNLSDALIEAIGNLDLDRGADGMVTQPHFEEYGATASCCKRMVEGMSQIHEDNSNELIIADSWFGNMGSLRAITEPDPLTGMRRNVIFSIKTGTGLFPKKQIKNHLKDAPAGCHVIYRGVDHVSQQSLWAIGWKFNKSKVLTYLATDQAGSIAPASDPYKVKFPDRFGNMRFRNIPRPGIVQKYYLHNNCIDVHNNRRQHNLALEKKWITTNPYFRFHTTLIGINTVDCFHLAKWHDLLGPLKTAGVGRSPVSISKFAGVLSKQLIALSRRSDTDSPEIHRPPTVEPTTRMVQISDSSHIEREIRERMYEVRGFMVDRIEGQHTVCLFRKRTQNNNSRKTYRAYHTCELCKTKSAAVFCLECKICLCYPLRRKSGDRMVDLAEEQMNSCFQQHVDNIKRESKRAREYSDSSDEDLLYYEEEV